MSAQDRGGESLTSLLDDAAVELDIVAGHARPDFADMVARAQRLDTTRSLTKLVDEARRLDGLRSDQLEDVARIGDLDAIIESARDSFALVADASDREGVPPLRTKLPVRRGRRATWAVVVGVAAMLVAALSLGWGLRARSLDRTQAREYSGANQIADADEWSQAHIDDEPRGEPKAARRAPAPAPVESITPEQARLPPALPTPEPRKVVPSPAERLVAIDQTARAAWKRGDLNTAEDAFDELVRRGGRRSLVDLAYGDLFELARQRHDPGKEARLWQRYLRRFPNGRFADEARAGLCRRATGAGALTCWQEYLDERPHGTYRDHARAALGTTAPRPR